MAADNGRAREFIRRKDYKDKTRCYECGVSIYLSVWCALVGINGLQESGHLSYTCPNNVLGDREQPKPKQKQKQQKLKSK